MSTFFNNPFESELSPPDQFNALEYLLGPQPSEQVVYQSNNSPPEVSNNVDLNCLDAIFSGVINRPMDEVHQLLMEAGIEIGQSKNINPVAVENETQAASSDFGSSEPYAQPPLQMPGPDDIVLLQVERNSNETKMTEEPCVPVEPDPHPDEHRVVTRKMASKSQRKPLKPIENESNSSMNTASPDVLSHDELMTDRRKQNHRRAQQTYTKRISSYFEKIRELLSLKKSTSYTACLDKVTTELKFLMRRVDSLTEEATVRKKEALVRNKLVESLQQDNEELRHEVNRLQETNSDLHQGLESNMFIIRPLLTFFLLHGEEK